MGIGLPASGPDWKLQNEVDPAVLSQTPISSANRAIIRPRDMLRVFMGPPEKTLSDAEVDELYGLEPVIGGETTSMDTGETARFVRVACPYCGEQFETSVDASAGLCSYVEDGQICCQPIDMELRVDENGAFQELVLRRGDA